MSIYLIKRSTTTKITVEKKKNGVEYHDYHVYKNVGNLLLI